MNLIGVSDWLSGGAIGVNESLLAWRKSGGVVDGSGWCCPVTVLYSGNTRNGQPVHRFRLYAGHYRFTLELSDLLPQIPVRPLGVFVRFKGHVP